MALVTEFINQMPDRVGVHKTEVACFFHSFRANEGLFLQLDTRGSSDREIPGKVSQTIQLDLQAARKLLSVLFETFPVAGLIGVVDGGQESARESL